MTIIDQGKDRISEFKGMVDEFEQLDKDKNKLTRRY